MIRIINIVAFDIPFPADYGGVIDIYHKIRWLHQLGIQVHLHCFQYGRKEANELNKICKKVYYYPRRKYLNPFIGEIPYIVMTRNNEALLTNLMKNNAPILFEGLHTTYFLNHPKLKDRIKLVRTHNIEHDYYKNLEQVETSYFKKYFFRNESDNLKKYEKILQNAQYVLAISPSDKTYLKHKYHNAVLLPAYHQNDSVNIQTGTGEYILYHGNLGVGENNFAALYLVNEIFSQIYFPVIIAGNNVSKELRFACSKYPHIQLKEDWNNEQIMKAIADAQINVLPTFQGTGIKLKLLNALYVGRHCVVNTTMVNHTGLELACHIAEDSQGMIAFIKELLTKPFTEADIKNRIKIVNGSCYNNQTNTANLVKLIFP
ncbi:MAG: glycosyltransferase [bacterium]|nr:glycosyltransferase [bacterium]